MRIIKCFTLDIWPALLILEAGWGHFTFPNKSHTEHIDYEISLMPRYVSSQIEPFCTLIVIFVLKLWYIRLMLRYLSSYTDLFHTLIVIFVQILYKVKSSERFFTDWPILFWKSNLLFDIEHSFLSLRNVLEGQTETFKILCQKMYVRM